jgi:hypothetical protein
MYKGGKYRCDLMVKILLFDMWGTIIENGVFPSPVRQIKRAVFLPLNHTYIFPLYT